MRVIEIWQVIDSYMQNKVFPEFRMFLLIMICLSRFWIEIFHTEWSCQYCHYLIVSNIVCACSKLIEKAKKKTNDPSGTVKELTFSLFNNKNIHEKNILMINGKPLSFHRCPRSWSISPHLPTNTPIPHHISANDTYWQWRYSGMYADQGLKEFHQWYHRQAATDWNTPHNSLLMLTLSSSIFLVSSGRKSSHFNLSKRRQGF